jgi:hypothetical protein
MSVRRGWMGLPGCSSWFSGAEVDGARDSSWRHRCFAWVYLAAKPSHVGVDMDELACPLHHPTVCDRQTRGHSFLSGAAPSRHAVVDGGAFPGGRGQTPGFGYLMWC